MARRCRYYTKAVNCCAEITSILNSGPDGGFCASADDCRGYKGNCGDLSLQFDTLAVLPDYPNGLQECVHARCVLRSARFVTDALHITCL
jgi:hypothetical protein